MTVKCKVAYGVNKFVRFNLAQILLPKLSSYDLRLCKTYFVFKAVDLIQRWPLFNYTCFLREGRLTLQDSYSWVVS